MLAFDIETQGLDSRIHQIIVASVYDPDRNVKRTFHFMKDSAQFESEKNAFVQALDGADSLCSFNGIRFDIPFIASRFGIPPQQHAAWVLKTFDYFEVCKLCFASSCSLNKLLLANGYQPKISHGLQAIEWANQGRWEDVEEYCMSDAMLTHSICTSEKAIMLPLTGWSHPVTCVKQQPALDARSVQTPAASIFFV